MFGQYEKPGPLIVAMPGLPQKPKPITVTDEHSLDALAGRIAALQERQAEATEEGLRAVLRIRLSEVRMALQEVERRIARAEADLEVKR